MTILLFDLAPNFAPKFYCPKMAELLDAKAQQEMGILGNSVMLTIEILCYLNPYDVSWAIGTCRYWAKILLENKALIMRNPYIEIPYVGLSKRKIYLDALNGSIEQMRVIVSKSLQHRVTILPWAVQKNWCCCRHCAPYVTLLAAYCGNLPKVQWLHENWERFDLASIRHAYLARHVHILRWAAAYLPGVFASFSVHSVEFLDYCRAQNILIPTKEILQILSPFSGEVIRRWIIEYLAAQQKQEGNLTLRA